MLRALNLSKTFHSELLFDDVTMTVGPGDRIGLVGPNGAGKSTLLRLLVGVEDPTSGRVERSPGTTVGFLPQQVFDPAATVGELLAEGAAELRAVADEMHSLAAHLDDEETITAYADAQNRWLDLRGWMYEARLAEVRQRLDIAHLADEAPMATLSGGEQARVLLASVLLAAPTVLVLDEPTNHLDAEGIAWLAEHLRRFPGGVLVVTHDRAFLDATVTRVVELDGIHETPQVYEGGYTAYRAEKTRRWEALRLAYEAQEKYHRQLLADIAATKEQARKVELTTKDSTTRRYSKKVARKAISRERRLAQEMRSARWIAEPRTRPGLVLAFDAPDAEDGVVLRADRLGLGIPRPPAAIDLAMSAGDRVVLRGRNGAGKTTLLRTLAGQLAPAAGAVGAATPVALLPQTHDELRTGQRAIDHFRAHVPMYEEDAEVLLDGYLFDLDEQRLPMRSLSAGQLRRLLLAVMVNSGAGVLLLDEPTNYLDFDSLDVVETALRAYPGTVLMVTHDERFAANVGFDRVLELTASGLALAPVGARR